ncbi:hypothetical protein [Vibrio sp. SCSIO 43135]|nr:hypothetical protein [Vibrio sp. SCSIO 43135]
MSVRLASSFQVSFGVFGLRCEVILNAFEKLENDSPLVDERGV